MNYNGAYLGAHVVAEVFSRIGCLLQCPLAEPVSFSRNICVFSTSSRLCWHSFLVFIFHGRTLPLMTAEPQCLCADAQALADISG